MTRSLMCSIDVTEFDPQRRPRSRAVVSQAKSRWVTCLLLIWISSAWAGPSYDLAFSIYLGGARSDWIRDVCLDYQGNPYITGTTHSPDFPTAGTPYQPFYGPGSGNYNGNAFPVVICGGFPKSPLLFFCGPAIVNHRPERLRRQYARPPKARQTMDHSRSDLGRE